MTISLIRNTFLLIAVSAFLAGCSISYSFGKSSDSISASSKSLTSSSGGDEESGGDEKKDEEKASEEVSLYMEDVTAATALYASKDESNTEFQNQIAAIAKSHGITDWESEKSTFTAMGEGLKKAGVSQDKISDLSYFKSISTDSHYSLVISGYQG